MEQASNELNTPETACKWIAAATAIFRELARKEICQRLKFYSGNGNAAIHYAGNAEFILIFDGNKQADADKIVATLRSLERKRQLTIENFENIDAPTFLLHARILP